MMVRQILIAGVMAVGCCLGARAQEKSVELKIVETTDVHGSFYPINLITNTPKKGGLVRVSSYVNETRAQYGDRMLLLDNGDVLQGQPSVYYFNYIDTTSTHLCSAMFNYMRYDVGNFGNHDIETGRVVFDRWKDDCNFPILGANIIDTKTGEPAYTPYVVFNRHGVKVAVLGLLTPSIPAWLPENLWSGLRFDPMVETAERWMKVIRERENPDVVIGLFHSGQNFESGLPGENASLKVAAEVPGFDAVLIGHDHLQDCKTIVNVAGDTVWVLNPANNAMKVGELTVNVSLDKDGKMSDKRVSGRLVDVSDYPEDAGFMSKFSVQYNRVHDFVSEKVGYLKKSIYTRDAYFGSSSFIDLIHSLQLEISGADISITAPLSFDASINKGDIYVRDMFNLYKYENLLYTMRLTGREIKSELEESYYFWTNRMTSADDDLLWFSKNNGGDSYSLQNMSFNFDSAAGIIYTVDVTKPRGEKVNIISLSDGTPFEMDKYYKVAVNSYRGNGGGGLLTNGTGLTQADLKSRIISSTDRDLRFYLMEYIKEHGTLNPKAFHQWKFIPEKWTVPAAKRDYKRMFGGKYVKE
jgi:2',3'-cyclic-nucleotide 2'-phosphodiesterase/3'-nucleotidase